MDRRRVRTISQGRARGNSELVKPWRVDPAGQAGGNPPPVARMEGIHSARRCRVADWPAEAFASFGDIGLDLLDPDLFSAISSPPQCFRKHWTVYR